MTATVAMRYSKQDIDTQIYNIVTVTQLTANSKIAN